jgi:hypothetical protein
VAVLVIIIFAIFIISIMVLQALGFSVNYRANHYYHLTQEEIEKLISQRWNCYVNNSVSMKLGKKSQISIENNELHLRIEGGQENIIKLNEISASSNSGLGWLFVRSNKFEVPDLNNGSKIKLFFGNSQLDKLYSDKFMPLPWISLPEEVTQADKAAIAFNMKIQQAGRTIQ